MLEAAVAERLRTQSWFDVTDEVAKQDVEVRRAFACGWTVRDRTTTTLLIEFHVVNASRGDRGWRRLFGGDLADALWAEVSRGQ